MPDRLEAAAELAALFGDRGATVLAEADFRTWEDAVAAIPDPVFEAPIRGPHPPGEMWLSRLRDHWARAGQLRPAIAATRGLVRRRAVRLGEAHPDTLFEIGALGALADRAGRRQDAGRLLEQAWQGLRSAAGGRDLRVAVVAEHVGAHYARQEAWHEAETAFDQAWRIRKELAPGTQGAVAGNLGDIWVRKGRTDEAVPLLQESYDLLRAQLGAANARTLARARSLADALSSLDRDQDAEPVLQDLYSEAKRAGDRVRIAAVAFQLGMALYRLRREEAGYRTVQESIQLTRELDEALPTLPHRLSVWSRVLRTRGHLNEAEGVLLEAIEAETTLHGDASPEVALRYVELAEVLIDLGRSDEAMGWLDPAVSLLRSTLGENRHETWHAAEMLARLLYTRASEAFQRGENDMARELKGHAALLVPILGPHHQTMTAFGELPV